MRAMLVLLVLPIVLAVSIRDEVLPWLRDAWVALALPEVFPEADMAHAVQAETFEDLESHLHDSPDVSWTLFAMAVGRVVPAMVAAAFVTQLRDAMNERRAAEMAQARHPQTSCIVICSHGNAEDNLPPAVGCVPQPRIGDGPIRFGRAPSRAQLVRVQGLPALGALTDAWPTSGRVARVQLTDFGWLKVS